MAESSPSPAPGSGGPVTLPGSFADELILMRNLLMEQALQNALWDVIHDTHDAMQRDGGDETVMNSYRWLGRVLRIWTTEDSD